WFPRARSKAAICKPLVSKNLARRSSFSQTAKFLRVETARADPIRFRSSRCFSDLPPKARLANLPHYVRRMPVCENSHGQRRQSTESRPYHRPVSSLFSQTSAPVIEYRRSAKKGSSRFDLHLAVELPRIERVLLFRPIRPIFANRPGIPSELQALAPGAS